jgi:hypothetical protein
MSGPFKITRRPESDPGFNGQRIQPRQGGQKNLYTQSVGDAGITKADAKARKRAERDIVDFLERYKKKRWAFATRGTWLDTGGK